MCKKIASVGVEELDLKIDVIDYIGGGEAVLRTPGAHPLCTFNPCCYFDRWGFVIRCPTR